MTCVKYNKKVSEEENLPQNIRQINNRNQTGNELMRARTVQIKETETVITNTMAIPCWDKSSPIVAEDTKVQQSLSVALFFSFVQICVKKKKDSFHCFFSWFTNVTNYKIRNKSTWGRIFFWFISMMIKYSHYSVTRTSLKPCYEVGYITHLT